VPGIPDDDLTIRATRTLGPPTPAGTSRFAPGSIIAGRYRLVAMLGRGGMGEVYRAEDLTLDQPVALKFLPEGVAASPDKLAQFHNELRTARQVSHKNVVRLYDLGDANGRRFLTMEYVDGEDLASLLRRIGRIPHDKAIELARQLCAGVAAAHERGVLHRDLKPANIMIDGDGNVRITDFGIATVGAAGVEAGGVAGTPQYMAPEQLAGMPASVKTDVYALGLILFEIFTGKRAYDAKTLGDLKQLHDTGTVMTPSSVVRDLDPAVERVILRCLDKDPEKRPGSALAVAAGLPGGDPLAAALAAGETPSPEMLVAAGEQDALSVGKGVAAVAFIVVGAIALLALSPMLTIVGHTPVDKPPAVLVDRAQQIRTSLGYTDDFADSAYGFTPNLTYLNWLGTTDPSPTRWDALKAGNPSGILMWHRTSPRLLVSTRQESDVSYTDPPVIVSGMTSLIVDSTGRLIEFQAVPPQVSAEGAPAPPPNWKPLFDAAGLDMAGFTSITPTWSPRDFADTRAAWEGPMTGRPNMKVRIEAAAYRGRPTSMFLLGPWSRPTRMAPIPRTTSQTILNGAVTVLMVVLTIAALGIARHNVNAQRADRRGATRLAFFVLAGYTVMFPFGAHHVPDVQRELNLFLHNFGGALTDAGILWILYLALEPYVRRFWPDGILGWTRLLSGHVRDPRVGRDLLTACVITTAITFWQIAYALLPRYIGYAPPSMFGQNYVWSLSGVPATLNAMWNGTLNGMFASVFVVLGYVLLRLLLRRTVFAIAAAVALLAVVQAPQIVAASQPWIALTFQAGIIAAITIIVVRYGLLVTVVCLALGNLLGGVSLTPSVSHWTATPSNLVIGLLMALVGFGFYASRAGQPLFGKFEA
jgi:hypothetical protein